MVTKIKLPVYDRGNDGNVFSWIMNTAATVRAERQRIRQDELKKPAKKSTGLDKAKVEN